MGLSTMTPPPKWPQNCFYYSSVVYGRGIWEEKPDNHDYQVTPQRYMISATSQHNFEALCLLLPPLP